MLNEQILGKITREDASEHERLNRNYWQAADDFEFSNSAEDSSTLELQLKNLLDYEAKLKAKYL
jgi:hypothetical protein